MNLEVVWKFLSTGVPRVHGDEDSTGRVEHKLGAFKHELLDALSDRRLNAVDLLRYHRQNFQLNTIELVEARPRAGLRQTLEELAHRLVVEAVGTVEHHALTDARATSGHNITVTIYHLSGRLSLLHSVGR